MPGVALHCHLAHRILSDPSTAARLPFHRTDPASRNAFLQGAIGPDMGYFPGAEPFWSDLTHYVRPADLARTLVREAATEVERAFAWGWVTHLLADVAIHPLINRACGELVLGDPDRPLTAADDPASHLRVEMGLDLVCSAADTRLRSLQLRPMFAAAGTRFLARAFHRTYGIPAALRPLLTAHQAAGRLASSLLVLHWLLPRRAAGERRGPLGRSRARAHQAPHRASGLALTGSFLTPVGPAPWLILQVREEVSLLCEAIRSHLDDELVRLPNLNLDTGAADDAEPAYSRTADTLRALTARHRGCP